MDNPLLNPGRFRKWAAQPESKAFFQFLQDRRLTLARSWAEGNRLSEQDQGKAVELGELANLEPNDLRAFYGLPDAGDDE